MLYIDLAKTILRMKAINIILICFVFLLTSNCQKIEMKGGFDVFVIEKGDHEITPMLYDFTFKQRVEFVVQFDSSAKYQTIDPKNQCDVNKLYGFTDCNSLIHENSARFGWNWKENKIQIFSYTYVDKERIIKYLTDFEVDKTRKCALEIKNDKFYYYIDGVVVDSVKRAIKEVDGKKFYCHPYFGGEETAPHKVTIKIKML